MLGINPLQHLLSMAGVLASLPAEAQRVLTGKEFFPHLLSEPFSHGLDYRVRGLGRPRLHRGDRVVRPRSTAGPRGGGQRGPEVHGEVEADLVGVVPADQD